MKLRYLTMSLPLALLTGVVVSYTALAVPQDAVVGDGTPASCDNNALGAALAGGAITFNCGRHPTPSSPTPM